MGKTHRLEGHAILNSPNRDGPLAPFETRCPCAESPAGPGDWCPNCDGRGIDLTSEGDYLLAFIKRWLLDSPR